MAGSYEFARGLRVVGEKSDGFAITVSKSVGVPVETGIRFTTVDAAAVHADPQARNVDVGQLLQWPGVPPMFAVRDADGNGLEIVEAA